MLLTAEPTVFLLAVLWLPVLLALGAAHTVVAWRIGRRRGARGLAMAWGASTGTGAAIVGVFAAVQATAWGARSGLGAGVLTFALAALPLAICLGAATVVARSRLAARLGVSGVAAGAGATVAVWVGLAVLAVLALRLLR